MGVLLMGVSLVMFYRFIADGRYSDLGSLLAFFCAGFASITWFALAFRCKRCGSVGWHLMSKADASSWVIRLMSAQNCPHCGYDSKSDLTDGFDKQGEPSR